MASFGSLIYYTKNGMSEPFLLSYGKTTIGSSESHHIRIKGEGQLSCILDSNEVGVTILVNENENKNILINSEPTSKYTVMRNGDDLEVGKKKFKYSNPSLKAEYLEQTQQTLNKKLVTVDNTKTKSDVEFNPPSPLRRLQKVEPLSNQRRFSTGSKFANLRNSPRNIGKGLSPSRNTSTPQSPSRARFSRRMVSRRNSTLASVMENEVFDFQSPRATPISKTNPRVSLVANLESPSAKKNNTFSGTSKFSSPIPAKNKTYSGNISDVSENVTTPENNVTVDSITPLNVSKKRKKSMNRSRTLSYVDFPNSSTPKSAIKMNRSSSLYRPVVEDITPASPLPRSSLRNSSLKKLAFTQRRSVNFNISSSSDRSTRQSSDSLAVLEASSAAASNSGKRKRNSVSDMLESPGTTKKTRLSFDDQEDRDSAHDSSISGIQNLSDASFSKKESSTNISTSSRSRRNMSLKDQADTENQSIVSWNVEVSSRDMDLSGLSENSSFADTPEKSKRSMRSSNISGSSVGKINRSMESITSHHSNMGEAHHSRSFPENTSPTNLESILDDSLDDSSEVSKSVSSRSTRSSIFKKRLGNGKMRSKSLNLRRESGELVGKHSRTLGGKLEIGILRRGSLRNVSSTPVNIESKSVHAARKSSMRSKLTNSLHEPSTSSKSMTLDLSPIKPNSLKDFKSDIFRSRRSSVKIQDKGKGKIRSKSLNLRRDTRESVNKHSKTLGNNLMAIGSEQRSLRNVSSTIAGNESSRVNPKRRSTVSEPRSRSFNVVEKLTKSLNVPSKDSSSVNFNSLNKLSKSLHVPSRGSTSATFNSSSNKLSKSLHVPTRGSTSATFNSSSNKLSRSLRVSTSATLDSSSNSDLGENILNESESFISATSTSLSSSMLANSISELNDSMNTMSESMKVRNVEDSFAPESSATKNVTKTPTIVLTRCCSIGKKVESPGSSRRSLRSRSLVVSDDLSEFSSVSGVSSGNTDSGTADEVFKTPNVKRAPRKLEETPNHSFQSTNDPTSIKPMEELLQENIRRSSRRSTRSSFFADESLTDGDNQESAETSLSRSWKSVASDNPESLEVNSPSNISMEVTSAKKTPRNNKQHKTPNKDLAEIAGAEELLKSAQSLTSPKNMQDNVVAEKKFVRNRVQHSPRNDLTEVFGVKKLMATPRIQNSPKNDLTNIVGVKMLLKTPKVRNSPKNDLSNIAGVKKLLKTPRVQNSPKNDLTNIGGVKKLMKTPKVQNSPRNDLTNIGGVKKLLRTPKVQKSPKNDLTNIGGVKKLLRSPKVQNSPRNDLTNVGGVKKLMRTPKVQNSPKNDLTNVGGVKKLMTTPKLQKSPKNELTNVSGLKKLMASPKQQKSPKNDLTDIKGVKKLLKTPKAQKSPKNELLDVRGIRNLLRTPKNKPADESHDLSGIDILFNESQESNFDKLLDKKPPRTYGRSPKANTSQEQQKPDTPEHVLKWLEDQSNLQTTNQIEESRMGKRKSAQSSVTPAKSKVSPIKRQNRDESVLNSTILDQPSSTPKVNGETSKPASKAGISVTKQTEQQTSTRSLRGKRKLETDATDEKPSPKKTRGKKAIKTETKDNTNESEIDTPVDKKTRKTRQANQKELAVEQPPQETRTRQRRGKKEIEINKNLSNSEQKKIEEKEETVEEKQPAILPNKRLKVTRQTRRTNKDESSVNSNTLDEPSSTPNVDGESSQSTSNAEISNSTKTDDIKVQPKTTRSLRGKRKLEDADIPDEKPSPKKTRGKRAVKAEAEDNTKESEIKSPVEQKTRKTRRAKQEELTVEKLPEEIKTRQRRGKKEMENQDLSHEKQETTEEKQPTKQTRVRRNIKKINPVEEEEKVVMDTKSKKPEAEPPTKRNTRKTKVEHPSSTSEEEAEPTTTKNTRKKTVDPDYEDGEGKTTRSNKGKNKKYNEDEWDTPVKKNNKKQTVTFNPEIEYSKTPAEDIKGGTRNLRKRRNVQ